MLDDSDDAQSGNEGSCKDSPSGDKTVSADLKSTYEGVGSQSADEGVGLQSTNEGTGLQSGNEGTGLQSGNEGTGLQSGNEGTGLQSANKGTGLQSSNEGTGLQSANEGVDENDPIFNLCDEVIENTQCRNRKREKSNTVEE